MKCQDNEQQMAVR